MRSDPWAETIETWEATLIAAADPADFSFADFRLNELNGRNMSLPGGIGDFIARRLGPMAGAVETNTPVTRIEWDGVVRAHTPRGVITGRSCIVTVSTGVLAAGAIGFDPPLPAHVRDAIDALPMGLLTKVALRATGADRLDLPDSMSVQRQVRGRAEMFFNAWSRGHDHVTGFIGGPAAWALAQEGEAATMAFARERLRELFGSRADRAVTPVLVTAWADDEWHRGAYAYARPGHVGARGILGTPLAGGRLIFAGEAVRTDGLAGTVGGAWLSGKAAAS
jgi:monoamine oxidase